MHRITATLVALSALAMSTRCITLPLGKSGLLFKPTVIKSALPDPKTTPWPMGDVLPGDGLPPDIDKAKLQQAVDAAFDPAGMAAALVITYKGRIIAERYGENITHTTPLESWSMGKSLSGTLLGILIHKGAVAGDAALKRAMALLVEAVPAGK